MNPPYAQPLVKLFCDKLVFHVGAGDVPTAVVLVNNATETEWFGTLVSVASALCFPKGRVQFWQDSGGAGAPLQGQTILYIGRDQERFYAAFRSFGFLVSVQP